MYTAIKQCSRCRTRKVSDSACRFDLPISRVNFLSKSTRLGIYVSDTEGHILFWNHGATELFGWKEDDVLSKFGDKVHR
jgi:PAS domain-containing protein